MKKLSLFILLIVIISQTSENANAQNLYAFKYILKPKYKQDRPILKVLWNNFALGAGYNRKFNALDVIPTTDGNLWYFSAENRHFSILHNADVITENINGRPYTLKYNIANLRLDFWDPGTTSYIDPQITKYIPIRDIRKKGYPKFFKDKYGVDVLYKKTKHQDGMAHLGSVPITTSKQANIKLDNSVSGILTYSVESTRENTSNTGDSVHIDPYSIANLKTGSAHSILTHSKLKIYMLSKTNDTMTVKLWNRHQVRVHNGEYLQLANNSARSDEPIITIGDYDLKNYDDTFMIQIPNQFGIYDKYNMIFHCKYLIPISVPIAFNFGNNKQQEKWQSNFLSAGLAYGWGYGKTTFFKRDQMPSKNFYVGCGFLASISALTITTSGQFDTSDANVNKAVKGNAPSYTAPYVQIGVHTGICIGSIQLIQAAGFGWAIGYPSNSWHYQGRPWIGFGIGLNIFNLSIPGASSGGSAGGAGGGH